MSGIGIEQTDVDFVGVVVVVVAFVVVQQPDDFSELLGSNEMSMGAASE